MAQEKEQRQAPLILFIFLSFFRPADVRILQLLDRRVRQLLPRRNFNISLHRHPIAHLYLYSQP